MSYKISANGENFRHKTKDDVIARLIQLYNYATGNEITVTWPDGYEIDYAEWK